MIDDELSPTTRLFIEACTIAYNKAKAGDGIVRLGSLSFPIEQVDEAMARTSNVMLDDLGVRVSAKDLRK